jgi:photosystem II stability/assembly factor-like uncharacterized protein
VTRFRFVWLFVSVLAAGLGGCGASARAIRSSVGSFVALSIPRETEPDLLFLDRHVEVVSATPVGGSACSALYLSNDFVHWKKVTPRIDDPCSYYWTDAWFDSPRDGWVLGRDGDGVSTVLFHTTDAGEHWNREPGGSTGSNGGNEVVAFANENLGWRQQFATGSNRPFVLELTTDGGVRWSGLPPASCPLAPVVFVSSTTGFQGGGAMAGQVTFAPWLLETRDGGVTWQERRLALPSGLRGATAYYGTPEFFGAERGVLPVTLVLGPRTEIVFYRTTDGGTTWAIASIAATNRLGSPIPGPSTITLGTCGALAGSEFLPQISIRSQATWWILEASRTMAAVRVTSDGGHSWSTSPAPAAVGVAIRQSNAASAGSPDADTELFSADPQRAIVAYRVSNENTVYVETQNAGRSWESPFRSGVAPLRDASTPSSF